MTRLKLALSVDESGAVARAVIDRALAGDRIALRLCFEAILPKARSRPIELDLPVCDSIENVAAAFDVTVAAMAAGEITPDEALKVTRVLDRRRRALTARAARVAAEEPAETAATAAAPVAAASEPAGADLHSTCNNRDSAMLGAAAGTVDATIKAAGPPLPELGSSCILPAISGAASRRAGPIEPGSAVMDDLHFACIVGRKSGAHSTGDAGEAMTAADDASLFRPTASCIGLQFQEARDRSSPLRLRSISFPTRRPRSRWRRDARGHPHLRRAIAAIVHCDD